jgi:flagellar export protein FliJ
MKSFTFPLESVLEARGVQEDRARQQLAVALDKQREALARSREAVAGLNRILEAMAIASSGRFTAADRERAWSLRDAQERICAEARIAAAECARLADEKRKLAIDARRNRELLERLKASKREEWLKEAARIEQHQLDEFAMTRRFQAARQEYAVC